MWEGGIERLKLIRRETRSLAIICLVHNIATTANNLVLVFPPTIPIPFLLDQDVRIVDLVVEVVEFHRAALERILLVGSLLLLRLASWH